MAAADKSHVSLSPHPACAYLETFMVRLMRAGDSVEFVTGSKTGGSASPSSPSSPWSPWSPSSIPLPECLINEEPDHQRTADLLRHFMATGPRLQVMPGAVIDPVFEELCKIDWTLDSTATAISKLTQIRKKAVAAIVSTREDLPLEEIAERADEIERSIGHVMTLSRWMGLCAARKTYLLGMMMA